MTTTTRRLAALLLALLLTLTACSGVGDESGGGGDAGTDDSAGVAQDALAEGDTAAAASGGGGGGSDAAPDATVDLTAAAESRQIISTGSVRLVVEDLGDAVAAADDLVVSFDGLVFAEETDLRANARTRLTLKVPPRHFRELLDALAELGEVETQTIETDDVTEQVVDLASRISTTEVSVDRLRALLLEAVGVPDIAHIEAELLNRETTLETLRAQLRTIERQVALATVNVVFLAERTAPPPPADESQPGFLDGLRGGGRTLRVTAVAASATAGALLPWSPLLLIGLWLTRRHWWRRPAPTT